MKFGSLSEVLIALTLVSDWRTALTRSLRQRRFYGLGATPTTFAHAIGSYGSCQRGMILEIADRQIPPPPPSNSNSYRPGRKRLAIFVTYVYFGLTTWVHLASATCPSSSSAST